MAVKLTYRDAGVDVRRAARLVPAMAAIARKTHRRGLMAGIGGFAGLFDLVRYPDPVLVSSTDGVGTKLKIAFMMNRHKTVGIDLVAMSVNDVITQGAEPLFFLDYFATGKLRPRVITDVLRGIADGCTMAGCALMGGETAEMPSFYEEGEYDLAGFCVGVVGRAKIPDPHAVHAGDVVIGLPSSGLHSNGYSLARKVLLEHAGFSLHDEVAELGCAMGDELLKPTRIYAPLVKRLFDRYPIKGIAHITGGGLVENLPRILPPGRRAFLRRSTWSVPPIFGLIARRGRVPREEMDRTFNNGIGMVLVVAPSVAPDVERALRRRKEAYSVIGEIRRGRRGVSFSY
jgi:phosphoribosylformylglycinamidine cyclo-ligase